MTTNIDSIFTALGAGAILHVPGGLVVTSPVNGAVIATLVEDSITSLAQKIERARAVHSAWALRTRSQRAALLEKLAAACKEHVSALAEIIVIEAGKTPQEAHIEAASVADTLMKTLGDATLPEFGGMVRCKERPPVGVVGLITSFNFPLAVAGWTLAPALLAGNSVLWKPSEKTPLTALAAKIIFDKAMGAHADLLHIIIGGRDIGTALVAHEGVDMISATGSVAMGEGIKRTLAAKKNNSAKPILELGGNNGVIISGHMSPEHLAWSLESVLSSVLGTSGQRCTNTRRLIVHKKYYDQAVAILTQKIEAFIAGGIPSPLIDKDAFARFEYAKARVLEAGGKIVHGARAKAAEAPDAYFVEPALALMPAQTQLMHEEVFAPLLFVVAYDGDIEAAIVLLNAPANAGLVNGIYTQSQREAEYFAANNEAGHGVINSPKGTGTPAFGMGFGGNKSSGEGEILNAADALRPFTREGKFTRIAQNKDVVMDQ